MLNFRENKARCEFLRETGPFKHIAPGRLKQICKELIVEEYAQGVDIPIAQDAICDSLRVIRSGTVKRYIAGQEGDLIPIDVLEPGETFGFLQTLHDEYKKMRLIASEPTVCYSIRKEDVFALLSYRPSLLTQLAGKNRTLCSDISNSLKPDNRGLLGGEKLLFITPVGDLIKRPAVTVQEDASIAQAAEIMSQNRISSLIILNSADIPVGIVTDRDLRDKVIARRRAPDEKISSIMSTIIAKAETGEYCYEALLRMIRYNVHHVVVLDNGDLKGVLTNHDFMLLQGVSPLAILKETENQVLANTPVTSAKSLELLVGLLAKDGARASSITRIIAEMNDRIVLTALDQAEGRLGRPPVPYCWIVFGSEGRKEQTFRTDQDNGIIYADPATAEEALACSEYFPKLAAHMIETLTKIGFPPCPANYMANNPKWCQPLGQWERYFTGWIETPTAEAVLASLIFFDFRGVAGDQSLASVLRDHLGRMIMDKRIFLGAMANEIIRNAPPLTFFNTLKLENLAGHKGTLNLKHKGAALIIDIVRLCSLEIPCEGASTVERIHALKGRHSIIDTYGDELEQAFELMMMQRIVHQHRQLQAGLEADNFVRLDEMGPFVVKQMKQSYVLISRIQEEIINRYKFMIV